MKQYIICFPLFAMLLCIVRPVDVWAQKALKTVVLDAGHGGKDSGAVGKKSKEKDIVLDVTLRLGKMINDSLPEVNVVYTRDNDTFIPLNQRADIANKAGADFFISIHANSSTSTDVTGAETFVLGLHRSKDNLEVAQKENSVIVLEEDYVNQYEGFDPTQPESYIMFELMQNVYLEQSIVMASQIQDSFVKSSRGDRGVKQAGFLVLRQTSMPSVLVELGFISNAEEEAYMMSEGGKCELVNAMFKSFRTYKTLYDNSNKAQVVKLDKKEADDDKGIIFGVQIASTSKKLDKLPTKYGEVYMYEEKGVFKYYVGKTRKYEQIVQVKKSVKADYPDCFVIAFEDGKRVTEKYARRKLKD
ncbi:MAG: N-acetylmuramoyl-L-alanine amidase [Bacteroidales bacterium]|nr:N-acetylmuramoyl-L-alanine amidase [Bacteroidales bacterium]